MAEYTVLVQREPEAAGEQWTADGGRVAFEAPDAVSAALYAFRRLRVLPKRQRLLLWEGWPATGSPRIFHPGS